MKEASWIEDWRDAAPSAEGAPEQRAMDDALPLIRPIVTAAMEQGASEAISEPEGECRKSGGEATKPRWDLLPMQEVEQIVQVLSFGAGKYGDGNWKRGARWGRYYAALMRHLSAWWCGQDNDVETGLSHLAHAGCCLLFLMAYQANGWGRDDRCSGSDGEVFQKHDGHG